MLIKDNVDFRKGMFDITHVTESTNILKEFPRLAQHESFKAVLPSYLNKAILFRYIVLMYDSQLATREAIPDLNKRKVECAIVAGFKTDNGGKFTEEIESVIMCMNPYVNNMIVEYCRMQRMPKYTSLISIEEAHSKLLKKLMEEGTDKSSVLKAINDMETEMESRTVELLNHDRSFGLRQSLYEASESERLALRPEDIAENLRRGRDATDVKPYGKNYKAEYFKKEDLEKEPEKLFMTKKK